MIQDQASMAKRAIDDALTGYGFDPTVVYGLVEKLSESPDLEDVRLTVKRLDPLIEVRANYIGKSSMLSSATPGQVRKFFDELEQSTGVNFPSVNKPSSGEFGTYTGGILQGNPYTLRLSLEKQDQ